MLQTGYLQFTLVISRIRLKRITVSVAIKTLGLLFYAMSGNDFQSIAEFSSAQLDLFGADFQSPDAAMQMVEVTAQSNAQTNMLAQYDPFNVNVQAENLQVNINLDTGNQQSPNPRQTWFGQQFGDPVFGHLDPNMVAQAAQLALPAPAAQPALPAPGAA